MVNVQSTRQSSLPTRILPYRVCRADKHGKVFAVFRGLFAVLYFYPANYEFLVVGAAGQGATAAARPLLVFSRRAGGRGSRQTNKWSSQIDRSITDAMPCSMRASFPLPDGLFCRAFTTSSFQPKFKQHPVYKHMRTWALGRRHGRHTSGPALFAGSGSGFGSGSGSWLSALRTMFFIALVWKSQVSEGEPLVVARWLK